jgi:hypothetical protein
MSPKDREIIKQLFLDSLQNDQSAKWKYVIIEGAKTEYQISNSGLLASLRMCRLMSPAKNSDGYLETVISYNGKRLNVSIHRLVGEAFIPNLENLPQVNHKDGNKSNNWDWNLEWMTLQDNITHAIETGLRDNYLPFKRFSKKDIKEVCRLLENGKSTSKISDKTQVSKRVIRSIKRGKAWKHISKQYDIPGLNSSDRILLEQSTSKEQASTTIKSVPEYEESFIFSWERE